MVDLSRRMFFRRTFSLATVGIVVGAVPAIAKISPIEEMLRDMHEIKHTMDMWEAAHPKYTTMRWYDQDRYNSEISDIVSKMTSEILQKGMDLFPKDPSREDVKALFYDGFYRKDLDSDDYPSHIKYYNTHDPNLITIGIAKNILGVWKLPIKARAMSSWSPFVERCSGLLPNI